MEERRGEDTRWREWSVVFRSCASFANESLTTLLPQPDVAVVSALADAGWTGNQIKAASLDVYHLLLHLSSGRAVHERRRRRAPRLERCGGKAGPATEKLVSRHPAGVDAVLSNVEDHERAAQVFQNVSGEEQRSKSEWSSTDSKTASWQRTW